jgi:hypothetical protein
MLFAGSHPLNALASWRFVPRVFSFEQAPSVCGDALVSLRLSDQLCAAENRIAQLEARIVELETEAQHCREKSERTEHWLSKISKEIQQQVTGNYS